MPESLRTDDARFSSLPDWPYRPHYVDDMAGYEGLRMHHVDEGPSQAPVFLCLHGQPTWSYLYRRMIPAFLESGGRVVAPDFFGFGRSDKPVDENVYTWDFHRNSLLGFVDRLDLNDITLVVQDWGGILGLTLPVDMPERISRLLVMNTGFGIGVVPSDGWVGWRDFVARTPNLDIARLMKRACEHLTDAEADAYSAPFPGPDYMAGVRRFPQLVPVSPDMDGVKVSRQAAEWWSTGFAGQSFMAIGEADPVLAEVMPQVHAAIRGCPEPLRLPEAGHFVQEWGEQIATAALKEWGDDHQAI
jgi:haloalkane dehalogenase